METMETEVGNGAPLHCVCLLCGEPQPFRDLETSFRCRACRVAMRGLDTLVSSMVAMEADDRRGAWRRILALAEAACGVTR